MARYLIQDQRFLDSFLTLGSARRSERDASSRSRKIGDAFKPPLFASCGTPYGKRDRPNRERDRWFESSFLQRRVGLTS
jgi:hypothetical protein